MRRGRTLLVSAMVVVAGCIDLSTDPDEIVAIQFEDLPWPSVVAGDTLRDASGAIAPLQARLFNGDGEEVAGEVEFLSQASKVSIVDGNHVVAAPDATGAVNLLASTPGIQSIFRLLEVVPAPDSIAAEGTITPLGWVVPDDPATNTSAALGARVFSSSGDEPEGVRAWIVNFVLEVEGVAVPVGDTTQVFLVGDTGRPSWVDTTNAQGNVSRRVRLRIAPGLTPPDSAVVLMHASYRGVSLTGSPIRLVLPIQPR